MTAISVRAAIERMPTPANTMARPRPVNIMPMFSMDEYASSRFMSVCTAANTTPYRALNSPSASGKRPHHQSGRPSRSKLTRIIPYSATSSMTPLISAETGEGAAGCASGSHTCNGTSPALAPNPISARQNATAAPLVPRCAARMASKVKCQLPPCRMPKLRSMAIAPRWAITR